MRKWMRERLQRRKKTPAEASDQPAPPPLQPAYFDAEQAASAAPEGAKIESDIPAPPPPPEARPGRRVRASSVQQTPQPQSSEPQISEDRPAEDHPSEAQQPADAPAPTSIPVRSSNASRGRRR